MNNQEITLSQTTNYLLQKISEKYPNLTKKQTKTLFIEALLKNTVIEELNNSMEFILEYQPELIGTDSGRRGKYLKI